MLGCYLFNIGVDDLEEGFIGEEETQEEAHSEMLCRGDDFPVTSTPTRVKRNVNITDSPVVGLGVQDFTIKLGC